MSTWAPCRCWTPRSRRASSCISSNRKPGSFARSPVASAQVLGDCQSQSAARCVARKGVVGIVDEVQAQLAGATQLVHFSLGVKREDAVSWVRSREEAGEVSVRLNDAIQIAWQVLPLRVRREAVLDRIASLVQRWRAGQTAQAPALDENLQRPADANLASAGKELEQFSWLPAGIHALLKRPELQRRRRVERHAVTPKKRERVDQHALDQVSAVELCRRLKTRGYTRAQSHH